MAEDTKDDLIREPLDDSLASVVPDTDNPMGVPDDLAADQTSLDDTHPATDSSLQLEEEYDEGIAGAAEALEPLQSDAVIGYDPAKDQRRMQGSH